MRDKKSVLKKTAPDAGSAAAGADTGAAAGTDAAEASDVRSAARHSGPFSHPGQRTRYIILVSVLAAAAVGFTVAHMSYGNPMDFGTQGYWKIAGMRADAIITMIIVAVCQAFATVAFHTATNNRIITPSIMGFESLYIAVQTGVIFFLGTAGLAAFTGTRQFVLQSLLMIVFAVALFSWLLSGKLGNIHVMLLVGVVIGGGLRSLSTFMQRLLEPNEFDVLTARTFGNISNANTDNFPIVIPVVAVTCLILLLRSRRMNVIALGKDTASNLGLNHKRELMILLLLVAILMAMTTSMVGPMTFLGFLVATLAYQLTDTYDHRLILPVAVLVGYLVLIGSYFIMRNFFYAEGAVTIIIELVGGTVFLFFIMRKGRL
ncbi:MAG: iron chelate uptake ABC transporter family permease subunit [Corynebacterium sp.]|uniref:iron chelate uptake ABC transporter family permease subunit n=1 Tax=unclassified Corynebacterium TaxID=2624378 RepID=UPI0026486B3F|nr:iron chelate uptake ABC transporter family permease subunit [Corynebacterium sp.]MDN5719299.1 iron chelate uptake ABC transporter family permease subunit [Corynebacterium sp.]MDN6324074.1 iron chelate uptake ABC transporter family permease subunit [Corynebacterium sp.]